jgi:hypothetical protein
MKRVESIPNLPGLCVAVKFKLLAMNPFTRKEMWIHSAFVGVSAKEISAEASSKEFMWAPVIWKLYSSMASGGDDPVKEPPWIERRIEIPGDEKDATRMLDELISGEGKTWFLMEKN